MVRACNELSVTTFMRRIFVRISRRLRRGIAVALCLGAKTKKFRQKASSNVAVTSLQILKRNLLPLYCRIMIAATVPLLISSLSLFAQDAPKQKPMRVLHSASVYDAPAPGLLPVLIIDAGDTMLADSSRVDSLGHAWFRGSIKHKKGWVQASDVAFFMKNNDTVSTSTGPDKDKVKRAKIVWEHPQWPRRIQKAVRDGDVCLDMSQEQLLAAWGEPLNKGKGFMLGVGEYEYWFFGTSAAKQPLAVMLLNAKVVGWTTK